ncbi:GIY-YIG nuclease family protein [Aminipila sp.]|uniref:GIY-YIG nuclease family protein n=1 Tax=Aminipila sp. TaxID=2060095 RepID=UPI00289E1470|nr:GIY-YIG nuclease family protein [Aminipila sp.]
MDKLSKKQLKEQYKNRTVVGGVYCIKCNSNGRQWIKSTMDMTGQKNRFDFSVSINSCLEPSMRLEWEQYGSESFSFAILEEIKKGETQTEREFAEDVDALLEMWAEKQLQED